jgi:hypothetical protein
MKEAGITSLLKNRQIENVIKGGVKMKSCQDNSQMNEGEMECMRV